MTVAEVCAYGDPTQIIGAGRLPSGEVVLDCVWGALGVHPAHPDAFSAALARQAMEQTRPTQLGPPPSSRATNGAGKLPSRRKRARAVGVPA